MKRRPVTAFLQTGGMAITTQVNPWWNQRHYTHVIIESSSTLSTSKAVHTAHSDGIRQATSNAGEEEVFIATQAETNAGNMTYSRISDSSRTLKNPQGGAILTNVCFYLLSAANKAMHLGIQPKRFYFRAKGKCTCIGNPHLGGITSQTRCLLHDSKRAVHHMTHQHHLGVTVGPVK